MRRRSDRMPREKVRAAPLSICAQNGKISGWLRERINSSRYMCVHIYISDGLLNAAVEILGRAFNWDEGEVARLWGKSERINESVDSR